MPGLGGLEEVVARLMAGKTAAQAPQTPPQIPDEVIQEYLMKKEQNPILGKLSWPKGNGEGPGTEIGELVGSMGMDTGPKMRSDVGENVGRLAMDDPGATVGKMAGQDIGNSSRLQHLQHLAGLYEQMTHPDPSFNSPEWSQMYGDNLPEVQQGYDGSVLDQFAPPEGGGTHNQFKELGGTPLERRVERDNFNLPPELQALLSRIGGK